MNETADRIAAALATWADEHGHTVERPAPDTVALVQGPVPSLVATVLTPQNCVATRRALNGQAAAGVRDVWLVTPEPEGRCVEVFTLNAAGRYALRGYKDDDVIESAALAGMRCPLRWVWPTA